MVLARRPRPESLDSRVPRLDAPPPLVVVGEPPHVPHHELSWDVGGERDVPLERIFLALEPLPGEDDEVERSGLPPLRWYESICGDPLPPSLSIFFDGLLDSTGQLARHEEPLSELVQSRYDGCGEELPVQQEEGDIDLLEPRLFQQAHDHVRVVIEDPHVSTCDLSPPALFYALQRGVGLKFHRSILLPSPSEEAVHPLVVPRDLVLVHRADDRLVEDSVPHQLPERRVQRPLRFVNRIILGELGYRVTDPRA